MLENFRTGFVWEHFMNTPYAIKGLDLAGFKKDSNINADSN
jgi:hypothetical protein